MLLYWEESRQSEHVLMKSHPFGPNLMNFRIHHCLIMLFLAAVTVVRLPVKMALLYHWLNYGPRDTILNR